MMVCVADDKLESNTRMVKRNIRTRSLILYFKKKPGSGMPNIPLMAVRNELKSVVEIHKSEGMPIQPIVPVLLSADCSSATTICIISFELLSTGNIRRINDSIECAIIAGSTSVPATNMITRIVGRIKRITLNVIPADKRKIW